MIPGLPLGLFALAHASAAQYAEQQAKIELLCLTHGSNTLAGQYTAEAERRVEFIRHIWQTTPRVGKLGDSPKAAAYQSVVDDLRTGRLW